ncbi:hypothetical protein FRC11_010601 [Ceratobasidium sp. 423]|nr:hypothetical protein FRC11_010601 [Ceratobasidium sp. 423]
MGPDTCFGDISRAWGWHAQATGIKRRFHGGEFGDVPTGDAPLSLVCLPLGLNLGLNLDGFQAFKGKFATGGSYLANGVYLVINNLPFYQCNLIENMILVMGFAFEQMLEPLIEDLKKLVRGMVLPVYNLNTGEIEQCLVYANLSVLIVDWITCIKCTGHVGVTAENNHDMGISPQISMDLQGSPWDRTDRR